MSKHGLNTDSLVGVSPEPIKLQDNTIATTNAEDNNFYNCDNNNSNWCKRCTITNPIIVEGNNLGKFVLWTLTLTLWNDSQIVVKKRYNQFAALRKQLVAQYGKSVAVGKLPPKSAFWEDRFDGEFLEKRRRRLEYWANSVVLDPLLGAAPAVRQFVLPECT
jgi:hypothetical protein